MRLRSITAVPVAALSVVLAGCAPTWYAVEGCTPAFAPGSVSNSVDLSVGPGELTEVPFDVPAIANEPQLSIIEGDGDKRAEVGDVAVAMAAIFDAQSGQLVQQQPTLITVGAEDDPFSQAFQCTNEGARGALILDAGDLGAQGEGAFAVVFEVLSVMPGRANGWPRPTVEGVPSISHAPNGQPGISVAGPPPAEAVEHLAIDGTGDDVADGDTVVVQMVEATWNGTEVLIQNSTWDANTPQVIPAAAAAGPETIPAQTAIVGRAVGSELVLVEPTGDGTATITIIDILGTIDE